ncbi:MAG TPA: Lrp/AsnC family transcriptional regulator [Candidatus Marinimicrobia bacterium]|nr:Lrp/AsnC family transcriptional regulator [Candidatus Neomarinimicrobiota bacterium]
MKIDDTDRSILSILQKDGRVSASHMADELGISIPTVTERIKKLQKSGVIQGIQAVLDPKRLGLDVTALITLISESSVHYKEVTNAAKETPEVMLCFSTTGKGSHTLLIVTRNSQSLEELLRTIQSWPGVIRTETQVVLSSYKLVQNISLIPYP